MVETMRTETLAAWLEAALDQGSTGSTPLSDLSLWSLRPGPHSAAGALPAMQSDAVAHFPRTVGFSRPTGAQAQRWQRWQISKNADLNTLPCCVGLKSELFHAGTHSARPVTGRQQLWWNFQGLSQVFDAPHHWYWRHRTVCRFRKWSMGISILLRSVRLLQQSKSSLPLCLPFCVQLYHLASTLAPQTSVYRCVHVPGLWREADRLVTKRAPRCSKQIV